METDEENSRTEYNDQEKASIRDARKEKNKTNCLYKKINSSLTNKRGPRACHG